MKPSWIFYRAGRDLRRHSTVVFALMAGFAVAAALGGAWRLATSISDRLAPALRSGVQVVAYLRDDVTPARAAALAETMSRLPDARAARLVSSDEALARLRADLGSESALLDGVEQGFLPESVELSLAPGPEAPERARLLGERLRKIEGVADVDAMGDSLQRLGAWLAMARILGWWSLGLGLAAAATAVGLAIGIGRRDRRNESEVFAFLGETALATRLPAGIGGATAALLGGSAGLVALWAAFRGVVPTLVAAAGPLLGGAPRFLPPVEVAGALTIAVVVGALAGMAAASFRDPVETG